MSGEAARSPSASNPQQPTSPLASMVVFVGVLPDFIPDAPPTENLNLAPLGVPTGQDEVPAARNDLPALPPLPPRTPLSAAPPPPKPRPAIQLPPLPRPVLPQPHGPFDSSAPAHERPAAPIPWRSFASPAPGLKPKPAEKVIPAQSADSGEYHLAPVVSTTAADKMTAAGKVVRAVFAKAHAKIAEKRTAEEPTDVDEAIEAAPPWLVSFVVHIAMLIALGLIATTAVMQKAHEHRQEVEVVYREELGAQSLDDRLDFVGQPTAPPTEKPAFSPSPLPPVEDPLAGYQTLSPLNSKLGVNLAGDYSAPTVGLSFGGRQAGMKIALLGKYGGTATTEAAVQKGLQWLIRQQRPNGAWRLDGPYANGATMADSIAATAMALIALQGAGNTHRSGQFQEQVDRGWKWLVKQQDAKGAFSYERDDNKQMYSQAFATIALCELVGMTDDPKVRAAAQLAIQFAVDAQDAEFGGWRYVPRQDSDTSVTGWVVMALQSAKMARISVPSRVLDDVRRYLDQVQSEYGSKYSYQPGQPASLTMTAEALLCRQYLGWKREDDRLRAGAQYLRVNLPDWGKRDVYYWYYATQVLRHMEGDGWKAWNEVMRQLLPSKQETDGEEAGSWSPSGDRYGSQGGRLYVTCLSIYILEVYYRHLPLYSSPYQFSPATEQSPSQQPPPQTISEMR